MYGRSIDSQKKKHPQDSQMISQKIVQKSLGNHRKSRKTSIMSSRGLVPLDQEDKPTKLGVWRESLGLEALPVKWLFFFRESASFLLAACLCIFRKMSQ